MSMLARLIQSRFEQSIQSVNFPIQKQVLRWKSSQHRPSPWPFPFGKSVRTLQPNTEMTSRPMDEFMRNAATLAAVATMAVTAGTFLLPQKTTSLDLGISKSNAQSDISNADTDSTTILNWSGTHAVHTNHFYEPETIKQLEDFVRQAHKRGTPIRPIGSALSPNGIAFQPKGMLSMANLDQILEVDMERKTVTVQAGARVAQVVEALRPYGLTLPNLASIAEQQMGGFIQVGAHGTGATVAPVDHYVTQLRLITPALGSILLSEQTDHELFQLAKVGLGCLGIVAEITMECIPAHNLVEHTFVLTRDEAQEQLTNLLKQHKHMRYMWIPYTDAVVVVTNDPEDTVPDDTPRNQSNYSEDERFQPLRDLLIKTTKDSTFPVSQEQLKGMGFGELRDALLAVDPLNVEHVKLVNKAEAEFWKKSVGYQTKPSDELLQFDCGGQQWVWEVAFSTGTLDENNGNDMQFMQTLLQSIEEQQIPAPAPIEQRWTASSSSLMSPAHGTPDELHSWVGIIMYLPSPDDELQRREITERFKGDYCDLLRSISLDVNAASHWAKLEMPTSMWELVDLQQRMKRRYPLRLFEKARKMLDPRDILGNPLIDLVFGSKLKNTTSNANDDSDNTTWI